MEFRNTYMVPFILRVVCSIHNVTTPAMSYNSSNELELQ